MARARTAAPPAAKAIVAKWDEGIRVIRDSNIALYDALANGLPPAKAGEIIFLRD
jgi:hypothetical protein